MDWISEANKLFSMEKPDSFTNFNHCDECFEHNETLVNSSIDEIGLAELGNPAWDPICFCSAEGKKYYTPAFVRLCLETVDDDFYFDQFLFHLEVDGENNSYFTACSTEQRAFLAKFVAYMIETHSDKLEAFFCADQALRAYQIWSK